MLLRAMLERAAAVLADVGRLAERIGAPGATEGSPR
jgi:hypothetical protein